MMVTNIWSVNCDPLSYTQAMEKKKLRAISKQVDVCLAYFSTVMMETTRSFET
jgi:hypothetical protein